MSETDHETVSFAAFLDYRARRLRAPVAEVQPRLSDLITTPPDPPEPGPQAVAKDVPGDRRV